MRLTTGLAILRLAREQGFRTLYENGVLRVQDGGTTAEVTETVTPDGEAGGASRCMCG